MTLSFERENINSLIAHHMRKKSLMHLKDYGSCVFARVYGIVRHA